MPLDELSVRLNDLPAITLHLLCSSGKRSSQATTILSGRGYGAVNVATAESPSGTATATLLPTHPCRRSTSGPDAGAYLRHF
ncbi:hypothetical protein [Arthrobacter sp. Rue61a]|uniref:rhodanese-like domain-containing protein n=1 Tax=Arthrobacter sp. Rue61a TaxID=1118963 RepID=UPI00336A64E5